MKCAVCKREITHIKYSEDHHLVPRCKKGKNTILVCVDCGNQIHNLFSIQELTKSYNTLESLLADQKVQKWIQWIKNKKEFGFCMKVKKKK
jgi:5-methylcytosine-specific restriction endonuclease McrA